MWDIVGKAKNCIKSVQLMAQKFCTFGIERVLFSGVVYTKRISWYIALKILIIDW